MECEICGKREARYVVMIEGAKLNACPVCAKGAKIISEIKNNEYKTKKGGKRHETEKNKTQIEKEVSEDYANIIRQGLKNMTLSADVLAEKLNIKYSYLNHIVHGKIMPDIKLASRLEKELNIKLIEDVVIETGGKQKKSDDGLTLGDIIEVD